MSGRTEINLSQSVLSAIKALEDELDKKVDRKISLEWIKISCDGVSATRIDSKFILFRYFEISGVFFAKDNFKDAGKFFALVRVKRDDTSLSWELLSNIVFQEFHFTSSQSS